MKDKNKITYAYHEINQDMRNNKDELQKLLQLWIESPESELRTRLIKEINEELGSN